MKIRWGIIGPGTIARKFAEDMSQVENAVITAVVSRSQERARNFAVEFGIENYYDSAEMMLKADVCDAVYIATPHTAHHRDTLFCMTHNKHVLCEKPITVNAAQLEEVMALQKEKGLFCMEAYWTLFLPVIRKVLQWVKEDRIGNIQLIQANFGMARPFEPKGRLFNPQLAGGSLLDLGIYPCMFGAIVYDQAPASVNASGVIGKSGVDEFVSFQIRYESGRILQGASALTHDLGNMAVIYGERGRIEIDDFWMSRQARLVTDRGVDIFEDERETSGYNFEIEEVSRLIGEGKGSHPYLTLDRSLENVRLMDEIRRQIGLSYPFE